MMKYNKYNAFTIAELMVIMALLVIIVAAFAPVFTVRYNNASTENVWAFVPNDDENDAFYDQINKSMTAQAFIGVTPANKSDIVKFSPYSKVVIRPSNGIRKGLKRIPQSQIQFRYGKSNNGTGSLVGEIYADPNNLLFGGLYKNLSTDNAGLTLAKYNTSYGVDSLSKLSSGSGNSALGVGALAKLTSGNANTASGYLAGSAITTGYANTLLGTYAGDKIRSGRSNTVIGSAHLTDEAKGNTILGYNALPKLTDGTFDGNTAVGYNTMANVKSGVYNTALGANTFAELITGSYNTAVGYNACAEITGSKKTCIGTNSGKWVSVYPKDYRNKHQSLYTDSIERVYIGGTPKVFYRGVGDTRGRHFGGAAVLEVHNIDSTSNLKPFAGGNSSVVINGNLIVRGQTYLTAKASLYDNRPALMGFFLDRPKNRTHAFGYGGLDGSNRTEKVRGKRGRMHAQQGARFSCVCAVPTNDTTGRTSYDWTSQMSAQNTSDNWRYGGTYTDKSTGASITLKGSGHGSTDIDLNYAHMWGDGSCCPDLRSDIRLKNLESVYTAGLDEINRLKIYNYTYKNDTDKLPRVGVIAQDLKRVFPTAVSKDEKGYYRIRWDEMFYAAINAIKTINSKVETLATRIVKDQARIATLKEDNAKLEQKLDTLAKELTKLEQNKK